MLDRDAIFRSLAKHTDELHRQGVRRLGLFGSYARGDAREGSDIDFVVEFDHITFDRYMDVRFLLEDLFQRKIDLVPIDRIKPLIRDRILSEVVDAPGF
jgi:predicted nucleotidyltransferase